MINLFIKNRRLTYCLFRLFFSFLIYFFGCSATEVPVFPQWLRCSPLSLIILDVPAGSIAEAYMPLASVSEGVISSIPFIAYCRPGFSSVIGPSRQIIFCNPLNSTWIQASSENRSFAANLTCAPCPAGFYCPGIVGEGRAIPCPTGMYSPHAGSTSCLPCSQCQSPCDPVSGFISSPKPRPGCYIEADGLCYLAGQSKPNSYGCSICNPSVNATGWTLSPVGTICNYTQNGCLKNSVCNRDGGCTVSRISRCDSTFEQCNNSTGPMSSWTCIINPSLAQSGVCPLHQQQSQNRSFGCLIDNECFAFHTLKPDNPCFVSSVPLVINNSSAMCTNGWNRLSAGAYGRCDCNGDYLNPLGLSGVAILGRDFAAYLAGNNSFYPGPHNALKFPATSQGSWDVAVSPSLVSYNSTFVSVSLNEATICSPALDPAEIVVSFSEGPTNVKRELNITWNGPWINDTGVRLVISVRLIQPISNNNLTLHRDDLKTLLIASPALTGKVSNISSMAPVFTDSIAPFIVSASRSLPIAFASKPSDAGKSINFAVAISVEVLNCTLPLPPPANGSIVISSNAVGSTTSFSCSYGFTLVGSNTSVCTSSGNWFPSPPLCAPITCPPLASPAWGTVSTSQPGMVGDYRFIECRKYYILTGPSNYTCSPDQAWHPIDYVSNSLNNNFSSFTFVNTSDYLHEQPFCIPGPQVCASDSSRCTSWFSPSSCQSYSACVWCDSANPLNKARGCVPATACFDPNLSNFTFPCVAAAYVNTTQPVLNFDQYHETPTCNPIMEQQAITACSKQLFPNCNNVTTSNGDLIPCGFCSSSDTSIKMAECTWKPLVACSASTQLAANYTLLTVFSFTSKSCPGYIFNGTAPPSSVASFPYPLNYTNFSIPAAAAPPPPASQCTSTELICSVIGGGNSTCLNYTGCGWCERTSSCATLRACTSSYDGSWNYPCSQAPPIFDWFQLKSAFQTESVSACNTSSDSDFEKDTTLCNSTGTTNCSTVYGCVLCNGECLYSPPDSYCIISFNSSESYILLGAATCPNEIANDTVIPSGVFAYNPALDGCTTCNSPAPSNSLFNSSSSPLVVFPPTLNNSYHGTQESNFCQSYYLAACAARNTSEADCTNQTYCRWCSSQQLTPCILNAKLNGSLCMINNIAYPGVCRTPHCSVSEFNCTLALEESVCVSLPGCSWCPQTQICAGPRRCPFAKTWAFTCNDVLPATNGSLVSPIDMNPQTCSDSDIKQLVQCSNVGTDFCNSIAGCSLCRVYDPFNDRYFTECSFVQPSSQSSCSYQGFVYFSQSCPYYSGDNEDCINLDTIESSPVCPQSYVSDCTAIQQRALCNSNPLCTWCWNYNNSETCMYSPIHSHDTCEYVDPETGLSLLTGFGFYSCPILADTAYLPMLDKSTASCTPAQSTCLSIMNSTFCNSRSPLCTWCQDVQLCIPTTSCYSTAIASTTPSSCPVTNCSQSAIVSCSQYQDQYSCNGQADCTFCYNTTCVYSPPTPCALSVSSLLQIYGGGTCPSSYQQRAPTFGTECSPLELFCLLTSQQSSCEQNELCIFCPMLGACQPSRLCSVPTTGYSQGLIYGGDCGNEKSQCPFTPINQCASTKNESACLNQYVNSGVRCEYCLKDGHLQCLYAPTQSCHSLTPNGTITWGPNCLANRTNGTFPSLPPPPPSHFCSFQIYGWVLAKTLAYVVLDGVILLNQTFTPNLTTHLVAPAYFSEQVPCSTLSDIQRSINDTYLDSHIVSLVIFNPTRGLYEGVIATVTVGRRMLFTNQAWQCRRLYSHEMTVQDWASQASHWSTATLEGRNVLPGKSSIYWPTDYQQRFSSNAHWIFSDDTRFSLPWSSWSPAVCRLVIPPPLSMLMVFPSQLKNSSIYLNGELILSQHPASTSPSLSIFSTVIPFENTAPTNSGLPDYYIAVVMKQVGRDTVPGLLAQIQLGDQTILSSSNWLCHALSDHQSSGDNLNISTLVSPSYDASEWPNAFVVDDNNRYSFLFAEMPNISSEAEWIWAADTRPWFSSLPGPMITTVICRYAFYLAGITNSVFASLEADTKSPPRHSFQLQASATGTKAVKTVYRLRDFSGSQGIGNASVTNYTNLTNINITFAPLDTYCNTPYPTCPMCPQIFYDRPFQMCDWNKDNVLWSDQYDSFFTPNGPAHNYIFYPNPRQRLSFTDRILADLFDNDKGIVYIPSNYPEGTNINIAGSFINCFHSIVTAFYPPTGYDNTGSPLERLCRRTQYPNPKFNCTAPQFPGDTGYTTFDCNFPLNSYDHLTSPMQNPDAAGGLRIGFSEDNARTPVLFTFQWTTPLVAKLKITLFSNQNQNVFLSTTRNESFVRLTHEQYAANSVLSLKSDTLLDVYVSLVNVSVLLISEGENEPYYPSLESNYVLDGPDNAREFCSSSISLTCLWLITLNPNMINLFSLKTINLYVFKVRDAPDEWYDPSSYTIYLSVLKSSYSNLSSLLPTQGILSPSFNINIFNYSLVVYVVKDQVPLRIMLQPFSQFSSISARFFWTNSLNSSSSFNYTNSSYLNGVLGSPINLTSPGSICPSYRYMASFDSGVPFGVNKFVLNVTAENGAYSIYSITIRKFSMSIQNLNTSIGVLSPAFDPSETTYTLSLMNAQSSVTITAQQDDDQAHVRIFYQSGTGLISIPLAVHYTDHTYSVELTSIPVGFSSLYIVVDTPLGNQTTYYIMIQRVLNINFEIQSLSVQPGALSPTFDPSTLNYVITTTTPNVTIFMLLTPSTDATIEGEISLSSNTPFSFLFLRRPVTSLVSKSQSYYATVPALTDPIFVKLNLKNNDQNIVQQYFLTILNGLNSNSYLSSLSVSTSFDNSVTLSPKFNPSIFFYNIAFDLPASKSSIIFISSQLQVSSASLSISYISGLSNQTATLNVPVSYNPSFSLYQASLLVASVPIGSSQLEINTIAQNQLTKKYVVFINCTLPTSSNSNGNSNNGGDNNNNNNNNNNNGNSNGNNNNNNNGNSNGNDNNNNNNGNNNNNNNNNGNSNGNNSGSGNGENESDWLVIRITIRVLFNYFEERILSDLALSLLKQMGSLIQISLSRLFFVDVVPLHNSFLFIFDVVPVSHKLSDSIVSIPHSAHFHLNGAGDEEPESLLLDNLPARDVSGIIVAEIIHINASPLALGNITRNIDSSYNPNITLGCYPSFFNSSRNDSQAFNSSAFQSYSVCLTLNNPGPGPLNYSFDSNGSMFLVWVLITVALVGLMIVALCVRGYFQFVRESVPLQKMVARARQNTDQNYESNPAQIQLTDIPQITPLELKQSSSSRVA